MHPRLEYYLKNGSIDRDAYLEDNGACPVCNHWDIEGYEVTIDGNTAVQTVKCNQCEARWLDTYKLERVTLTGTPDDHAIEELKQEKE